MPSLLPGGWLPFGGGVRRCVGAAFAQFEARLVLADAARRFVLSRRRGAAHRDRRRGHRAGAATRGAGGGEVAQRRRPAAG